MLSLTKRNTTHDTTFKHRSPRKPRTPKPATPPGTLNLNGPIVLLSSRGKDGIPIGQGVGERTTGDCDVYTELHSRLPLNFRKRMSNMDIMPEFEYRGRKFTSVEVAYQYTKASKVNQHRADQVFANIRPLQARKVMGKNGEFNLGDTLREWECGESQQVMRELHRIKFSRSPYKEILKHTYPFQLTYASHSSQSLQHWEQLEDMRDELVIDIRFQLAARTRNSAASVSTDSVNAAASAAAVIV